MFKPVILTFFLFLFTFTLYGQVDDVAPQRFTISLEGEALQIPYYSNIDLEEKDSAITKAVIMIHGNNRNADDYYQTIVSALEKRTGLSGSVLLVAPQFLTSEDLDEWNLGNEMLFWSSGGWKAGSNSQDTNDKPRPFRIPSYAVLDSMMSYLSMQYPQLSEIVLAGHSAGGQVVTRMAATSPVPELLCERGSISLRFIVANPSSYVYLDAERVISGSQDRFRRPSTTCDEYNEWKYGLEDLFTYPSRIGAVQIREQFETRQVIYLLGALDNREDSGLDQSCEALLQGANRLERGQIYVNYLKHYYGEEVSNYQQVQIVPNVGHDNFQMYNSSEGVQALFDVSPIVCNEVVNAIEKDLPQQGISVYPNPGKNSLFFDCTFLKSAAYQVEIYSNNGQLLRQNQSSSCQAINTSGLIEGMYHLKIITQEGIYTSRFVIQ